MVADQHRLVPLVDDLQPFDHETDVGPLVVALLGDRDLATDRVADEDRLDEAQAVVAIGEGAAD